MDLDEILRRYKSGEFTEKQAKGLLRLKPKRCKPKRPTRAIRGAPPKVSAILYVLYALETRKGLRCDIKHQLATELGVGEEAISARVTQINKWKRAFEFILEGNRLILIPKSDFNRIAARVDAGLEKSAEKVFKKSRVIVLDLDENGDLFVVDSKGNKSPTSC